MSMCDKHAKAKYRCTYNKDYQILELYSWIITYFALIALIAVIKTKLRRKSNN